MATAFGRYKPGLRGRVEKIDRDGDLFVKFNGNSRADILYAKEVRKLRVCFDVPTADVPKKLTTEEQVALAIKKSMEAMDKKAPSKRRGSVSIDNIPDFLGSISLGKYTKNCQDNMIEWEDFVELEEEDLVEIGIPKVDVDKILNAIIDLDIQLPDDQSGAGEMEVKEDEKPSQPTSSFKPPNKRLEVGDQIFVLTDGGRERGEIRLTTWNGKFLVKFEGEDDTDDEEWEAEDIELRPGFKRVTSVKRMASMTSITEDDDNEFLSDDEDEF